MRGKQGAMPKRGKGSKLGALGSVKSFVSVVKAIDFGEVRAGAELVPRILVLARSDEEASQVGEAVAGTTASPFIKTFKFDEMPRSGDAYDAVVIFDPRSTDRAARVKSSLRAGDLGIPVVAFAGEDPADAAEAARVRKSIMAQAVDRAPAFGRHLPAFRPAAVQAIINETARANAQFSLVSNVPAAIPILGAFAAAGADMLVLTKNQVMMIYKIAAAHDQDLHDQQKILREIAPVVGAGFLWRTLARESASFLPLMIGTLPKVAVAYAGTVAAGRGADFYYRFGKKPTRAQMQVVYRQAAEAARRLPLPLPGRSNHDAA